MKVTAEEEARLVALAEAQGVTVARLLVESAMAGERGETASERRALITELFAVHRSVAGVANNVNQIARKLHATDELAVETGQVLAAALATMAGIDVVIDRLGMS
ncbi:MAG: plasmid mobilization relaxosome protein MobC [Candidatus Nanopelagicales bacterium]